MAPPSTLLLLAAAAASSANTFIPFLGRGTAQPSQPPTSQPPAPRRRLSDDDIKQLLRGRDALVLAASDTALGLSVAEGLTDVGARVILACREPKRVQRACDRMTARCRTGGDYRSSAVAPPGCEARALDLSDAGAVWRFADQLEREERPLHVLVNCADDACPLHSRNGHSGWERTAGSNHLGPFLLTNLLLDRMVGTMRADARAAADAAGLSVAAYAEAAEAAAAADRRDGSVRPRPAPAPLGRVITVGERARLTRRRPAPAAWLQLGRHNYSSWRARGRATRPTCSRASTSPISSAAPPSAPAEPNRDERGRVGRRPLAAAAAPRRVRRPEARGAHGALPGVDAAARAPRPLL